MQRLFENSPKYWRFTVSEPVKKPLRFRESIRGNTKQFIQNVTNLLDDYLPTEESWMSLEEDITSFPEYKRYGVYAAVKAVVEAGRFATYYNTVKDELAELYENTPEEKEKWDKYSNDKAWDRYCSILAMYIPKVFKKKFDRNIGEKLHESVEEKQPRIKENIRTVNVKRLRESKDKFIDKNPNLSDEEKEELKNFFNKHPMAQSIIDWSKSQDLTYEDFKREIIPFKHRKVMENRANRPRGRFVEKKNRLKEANFYNFVDLLDSMGWSYSNFQNVTDKNGKPYERFTLSKGGSDEKQTSVDIEEVKNALRKMFGNDVSFGTCHSKYAPENVYTTVIINSEKL